MEFECKKKKYHSYLGSIENALKVKRAFDVAVIVFCLPLLFPLFVLLGVIIKMDSKGSVFYLSKRIGKNGKEFVFFKFRTMQENAELEKEKLAEKNESEGSVTFKIKKDPRITRVGVFLRKFSLDELPQLLNVLRGDMSLVGPRPPIACEVSKYEINECKRLHFIPGLTCVWQVSGRSDIPFKHQVEMDLEYIRNYSILYDIKILIKTIPAVLKGTGAY